MKKLYIIYYFDGENTTSSWYWAKDEAEAIKQLKKEMADFDRSLNDRDIDDIYQIREAVDKADIINMLERYIIKPLRK